MTPTSRTTNAERSESTRTRLLETARRLFSERGYASVGTEEIVREARVTRGALYHHFGDKRDLFRTVHEIVERELADRIGAELAGAGDDPLELVRRGVRSFLDVCTDPAFARIALLEAPSVLGWEEWRKIDARYGLGLVRFGLENAMEAGAFRRQPVEPLAHLLLGAMGEAGMMVANATNPRAARAEVEPSLLALIDGLR